MFEGYFEYIFKCSTRVGDLHALATTYNWDVKAVDVCNGEQ